MKRKSYSKPVMKTNRKIYGLPTVLAVGAAAAAGTALANALAKAIGRSDSDCQNRALSIKPIQD